MRVVFLDIDGVLNHIDGATAPLERTIPDGVDHRALEDLDPVAIKRLNRLIEATNAVVVVSSSWRKRFHRSALQELLTLRGFRGTVLDVTPTLWRNEHGERLYRGHEIAQWLQAHTETQSFVILDDDNDMAHLLPFLVQTDAAHGLLEEHIERAKQLLTT